MKSIKIEKGFYKTDWPVMIISTVLLYAFIAFDGVLQRYEGIILVSFLIIFLIFLLKSLLIVFFNFLFLRKALIALHCSQWHTYTFMAFVFIMMACTKSLDCLYDNRLLRHCL